MMAMLGAWTAIYVFTFLRTASDQHQTLEPQAAIFAAVGLGVFTILAGIVLLGADRAVAFAVVVLVVSLFIAVLAHRAGLVLLAAAGLALSVVMMAIAAEISAQHHAPADLVFVGTVLGWSLVYVGGIAYGIYSGRTLGWPDLLTLSAAGLAGLALSIGATGPEVMTLRALIAAGFGAVFLGVGQLASARPELRPWVSILAAQALGLFAAAVGFGLSGATITIVWSVLALVAALVWAESKDPIFGAALALLASATIFRLLAVDIGEADRMVSEFRWSSGRSGVYRLTPFLNPRSYALIGTGAAFLAAAARLGRAAAQKTLKTGGAMLPAAGALAITAYLLLIGLAVSEVSAAVLELPPPPPMILDLQEFSAFMDTVTTRPPEARHGHHAGDRLGRDGPARHRLFGAQRLSPLPRPGRLPGRAAQAGDLGCVAHRVDLPDDRLRRARGAAPGRRILVLPPQEPVHRGPSQRGAAGSGGPQRLQRGSGPRRSSGARRRAAPLRDDAGHQRPDRLG
jgi:hypothetical protein